MTTPNKPTSAAAGIARQIARRAAKYASDWGCLSGLFVAAHSGLLAGVKDPERLIRDVQDAAWQAIDRNREPKGDE